MAEHVSSRKVYFLVFGALLVLTAATVLVAKLDLGVLNDVVAMAIAVTKGALVVLFFMHVAHSSRLTKLTVVASFFWLAILILITLTDYLSRPAVNAYRGVPRSDMMGQLGETEDDGTGEAAPAPMKNAPPGMGGASGNR